MYAMGLVRIVRGVQGVAILLLKEEDASKGRARVKRNICLLLIAPFWVLHF